MKELNIFVEEDDLSKLTDIFQKHKAGVTFFNVRGTGRTPRSTPEIVHAYQTGRTMVPKFIGKIFVISVVSDTIAKLIIDEVLNGFGEREEPYGVLFVKDVSNAYEIGTRLTNDDVLYSK